MVKNTNTNSSAFNTQSKHLLDLWDALQNLQANFAFRQELPLYYQCTGWHASESVLDVGCGNGHYLRLLDSYFPKKEYYGIDISHELITLAQKRSFDKNHTFYNCDFFDYYGSHDAIIMRLFLQHLPDPLSVIDNALNILRPEGTLFLIDSLDEFRFYHPLMPHFSNFFKAYKKHQLGKQLNRDAVSNIFQKIKFGSSWECVINQNILIPTTIEGNSDIFYQVFSLFVDMVEEVGELDYPFKLVRDDIDNWKSNNGYAQIGLKLLGLKRIRC